MSHQNWSRLAAYYPLIRNNPVSALFLGQEITKIKTLLRPITDLLRGRVLDLGSGRGHSLIFLQPEAQVKLAVDNCPEMIKRTKPDFPEVQFITADASALPLQSDSMDFVSCVGLLEYISEPAVLLEQIHIVLKDNGYLLLTSSPPGLLTKLRRLSGHRLFTLSPARMEQLLFIQNFCIINQSKTWMQRQYLVQKILQQPQ